MKGKKKPGPLQVKFTMSEWILCEMSTVANGTYSVILSSLILVGYSQRGLPQLVDRS